MPHCTLEYSSNIPTKINFHDFFAGLHKALAQIDSIDIAKIKSRAVKQEDFFVGDGTPNNAFVFLHIALFEGREASVLKKVGDKALAYMKDQFEPALKDLHCSMTIEVREIARATFFSISDKTEPHLKAM